MNKTLFSKVIFNVFRCEREYEYIDISSNFEAYMKLEEEILNNEYSINNSVEMNRIKRVYIDFCIYKNISKFDLYRETIDTPFASELNRTLFIDMFCKIQKVYFALIKFREIVKRKIYPKQITFDMKMVEINPSSKHCVVICQNNKLYYFTLSDMLNIIEHNLTSGDNFFVMPRYVKNPYNNVIFSKSVLYNIYYQYKFNTIYKNQTIEYFFDCQFDITSIKDTHYHHLLKQHIKYYVNNINNEDLIIEIKNVINYINWLLIDKKNHINISDTFPDCTLILAFKPFFSEYMQIKYALTYHEYYQRISIFKANIITFIEYNPKFGRVINKPCKFKIRNNIFEYIDKFISYDYKINVRNDFITSHYIENPYSVYHIYENKFKCDNIIFNRILDLGPPNFKYRSYLQRLRNSRSHMSHDDSDTESIDSEFEFIQDTPDESQSRSRSSSMNDDTLENNNDITTVSV